MDIVHCRRCLAALEEDRCMSNDVKCAFLWKYRGSPRSHDCPCPSHWNCRVSRYPIPGFPPQDSIRRGVPFSGVTLVSWQKTADVLNTAHLASAEVIDLKGFKWSDAQFSAVGVSFWGRGQCCRIYGKHWCWLWLIFTQDSTCIYGHFRALGFWKGAWIKVGSTPKNDSLE